MTFFGPLEPLHRFILDRAEPICVSNAHRVFLVPLAPLGVQAALLRYQRTRLLRVAIGVLGAVLLLDSWSRYRFVEPWFDAFNNGLGVAWLHLVAKYIEFALIEEPVPDPFGRGVGLSAHDLCINSRWIGLRKLALDPTYAGEDRWLAPVKRTRTRLQATLRHASLATFHLFIIDFCLNLIRQLAWDTIGRSDPPPNALARFTHHSTIVLFLHHPLRIPPLALLVGLKLIVGAGVWQGLVAGYHAFAAFFVGSGVYEVAAWEVDLFNRPWDSDSLIAFWGRGWHQLFRHHFLLLSSGILRALRLSPRHPLLLPLVFFFSGSLHALGQLSMTTPPNPLAVASFFFSCGVGCAAEVAWKRVTGRRVRGVWGRVWTIGFLVAVSTPALSAEFQSGLGGAKVVPNLGGRWAVEVVRGVFIDRVL